jgi:hypothetical protein
MLQEARKGNGAFYKIYINFIVPCHLGTVLHCSTTRLLTQWGDIYDAGRCDDINHVTSTYLMSKNLNDKLRLLSA